MVGNLSPKGWSALADSAPRVRTEIGIVNRFSIRFPSEHRGQVLIGKIQCLT
ncbi:MAG: hypothetical protein LBC02_11765 [Planctomycetaceae bacterium]|nr:hypothetical protein [Planctomycetaceae bacterium]